MADRVQFDWSTEDPPLNARYRFEWRFRAESVDAVPPAVPPGRASPSELMRGAGIVQRGAPMLDRAARWFDLPDQAGLATDVVARLLDALQRVGELHEFGKGLGLAAPQLGIDWAAAVVQATDGRAAPDRAAQSHGSSASRSTATSSTRAVCPSSTCGAGSRGRC